MSWHGCVLLLLLLAAAWLVAGLLVDDDLEHAEELNRESWEIYQASRRIHDETAAAFDELLDEARRHGSVDEQRELS